MSEDIAGKIGFILLALMFIALYQGVKKRDAIKVEAVERGHAEWVVDQNGKTEWRWKEVRSE